MDVTVVPLRAQLPAGLPDLIAESEAEGHHFLRRLAEEWASGANRFDRPGEALFAAVVAGRAVGVCGLNADPYLPAPGVGRVRHLYVAPAHRRRGVGRRLLAAVVAAAGGAFHTLRLRTESEEAAEFYEGAGFCRRTEEPACTHVMSMMDAS